MVDAEDGTIGSLETTGVSRTSRLLYWLTLAVMAVIAGFSLVQSLRPVGETFAGFWVLSDGRLHHLTAPAWNGAAVQMPWLQPVVSINGEAVASGRELVERVAALSPGTPVTYGIRTATGMKHLTIATQRYGFEEWLAISFVSWVLGVGYVLCGAVVSWLKPGHAVARIHFVACMLMGAFFLAVPDSGSTYDVIQAPLYWMLYVCGFGARGMLATVFPRPVPGRRHWQLGLLAGGIGVSAWMLADGVTGGTAGLITAWLGWGTLTALTLPASAAWSAWSRTSSAHERAVGRFLLFGFCVAFALPILLGWTQHYLGRTPALVTLSYLALLALPLTITIAVVRHRLFGVDVVVRQTLAYGLATGGMLLLYAAIVAATRLAIGEHTRHTSVPTAVVLALAFAPFRDGIRRWLDRRFFRAPYDPTAVIATFHHQASESPEPDQLAAAYARCLDEAMALRGVEITLASGTRHCRGTLAGGPDEPLILPLTFEDHPLGTVTIGGKRSDLPFSDLDRRFIDTLTSRLELWLHLIERLEAERRHQAMIADLQRSDEMKSEFLNLVSHELRRPLSEILATVNMLALYERRQAAPETTGPHLRRLRTSATMLAGLVNDLLDAEQLQTGRFQLRPGPLEIPRVIDDALNAFRPAAEAKGIALQADAAPIAGLCGDHLRLVQVLSNLLANAIRHTAPGGTITVTVHRQPDGWSCEVTDTGEGIPAHRLPKLFERFGGLDREQRGGSGGLGLGLHICRSIVEAHGGTLTVASDVGVGTRFRFVLPRRPPDPDGHPAAGAVAGSDDSR